MRIPRRVRQIPPAAGAGIVAGVVVVVAFLAAMVGTGSSWIDAVTWVLTVLVAILLPGAAVVRACRPSPASLGDDLAWSVPTGCVVVMVEWCVGQVLPVPGVLWGLLVAGALLAVPRCRGRVLARPEGQWEAPMTLSVAAVMTGALAWMTRSYLAWTPVDPGPHGHVYYVDSLYQGSLLSELGRSGVPQYPMVAGEPLDYHWFLYAIASRISAGMGIDRIDLVLRLVPVTLMLGALLLAASVARQIAGRRVAGPLAAGLIGVVGSATPTLWTAAGIGPSMVNTNWWSGPSLTLGWITGIAVVGSGVAVVRRAPTDRFAPPAVLLPFFVALTSGSKSSVLPVLACGFALAAAVAVLWRDWRQAVRAAVVTLLIAVVMLVAIFTIYGGHSYGLRLAPGRGLQNIAAIMFPGLVHTTAASSYLLGGQLPLAALVAGGLLWLVPQLVRWLGLIFLLRRRPRDAATWVMTGCAIAGLLAFAAMRHPGSGEIFFILSAFPIVTIGSACGLAVVLPHGERLRRWLTVGAGLAAAGFALSLVIATVAGEDSPLVRGTTEFGHAPTALDISVTRQIWDWSWPLLLVLAATAACVVGGWVLTRRLRIAALAGMALTIGVGLFMTGVMVVDAGHPSLVEERAADQSGNPPALTRDLVRTGDWLADHAKSTDVVAVNRACLPVAGGTGTSRCYASDFTITFATGLRSDVEGWSYAGRIVDSAWSSPTLRYNLQPFWDQPRLDAERRAFSRPSRASYDALYASGVRWLLADRPTSPLPRHRIDRLADRALTLRTVTLWRLRPPAG